ncbi:MAG TPA: PAS domain S-box protein [Phycisphaerales bacterium]|nr:PAS domain S-box protein [Phycisphaerales bacterium]
MTKLDTTAGGNPSGERPPQGQWSGCHDETETLSRVAHALATELDLRALLQKVTDAATDATGAACGACLYIADPGAIGSPLQVTVSGAAEVLFDPDGAPADLPHLAAMLRGGGAVRIADLSEAPVAGQERGRHGAAGTSPRVRSYLALPLTARSGTVLGGLFLGDPRPGVFSERAERLAVAIGAQAAMAIENARLYQQGRREIEQRIRAETALRDSDRRLRFAVLAGRMGVWDWDIAAGRVVWAPGGMPPPAGSSEAFDGSVEEALQGIHPQDRAGVEAAIRATVREGADFAVEYRVLSESGEERWMEARGSVFRTEEGLPQRVIGVSLDVTDRTRIEQALLASESRFTRFMQHLPGLAWIKDAEGRYLFANDAAAQAFGVRRADLLGRTDAEVFPPETAAEFRANDLKVLGSGAAVRTIEVLGQPDGLHYSVVSKFAIPVEGERPPMIGGIAIDITERIESERARSLLAAIVESSDDAIISKTLDGRVTSWNAGAERLFGYAPEDIVGRSIDAIIPEDRLAEESEILGRLRAGERVEHYETVRLTRDGRRIDIALSASPLYDDSGRIVGASKIARDITSARRAAAALRESEIRYRHLLETLPIALYTCDADGRITLYNAAAVALWGRSPRVGVDRWSGAAVMYRPDGTPLPHNASPMATSLRERRPHPPAELIYERPDGSRRHVLVHPHPAFDAQGALVGATNAIVDITAHRAAEDAVRASERHARVLLSSLPQLVWTCTPEGVCDFVSQRWLEYTGRSEAEQLGSGWLSSLHPDDRRRARDAWRDSSARAHAGADAVHEVEYRLRRHDGQYRWFACRASPVRDARGRVALWVGASADVQSMKDAESAVRDSEERFRTLADNISQLAWMTDEGGRIFWYNRRWFEYTGTTPEQVLGSGWTSVHHPDHVNDVVEKFRRSISEGRTWEDTFPLRGRDGRYRWFLSRAVPIRDEHGRILRWFGTNTDITEWREAQEALRISEERFRTMADSAPVLIWMTDADRRATWFNRPWLDFTGRTMEQELGDGWTGGIHPEDAERCFEAYAAASASHRPFRAEYRLRRRDGEYRWLLHHGAPLMSPTGRLTGYICSCVDVTDEVAARTALEHQQAALGEAVRQRTRELEESHRRLRLSERMASIGTLSAGLGHDMANILLPIRLRLDALDRLATDEQVRSELQEIRSAIEYLQNLSGGLRMLVVDPSERTGANTTELAAWWRQAAGVLKSAAPSKIELVGRMPEQPCWVRITATALTQVVFNLVQNSIEALRPRGRGRIEVRALCEGRFVVLSVADDGPGMEPHVRERCTQPFFTTKTRAMSTGLGLALVYGMVQEAGGSLEIQSAPGQGTTVMAKLIAAGPPGRAKPGARLTALVEVKHARTRAIVGAELHDLGFTIVDDPAAGGAALRVLDHPPSPGGEGDPGTVTLHVDVARISGNLESNITEVRRRVRDAANEAISRAAPRGPSSESGGDCPA